MHNLDIDFYIEEAEEIERLYNELLAVTAREIPNRYNAEAPPKIKCEAKLINKTLQRKILRKYEIWYESCRQIVHMYADNHNTKNYEKFCSQYSNLKKIIDLDVISLNNANVADEERYLKYKFIEYFDIQVNILHTINPTINFTRNNYKKLISADILNSELDEAEMLYENEFIRPAGIIAGIVLERYLKTLCEINGIELESKDTMVPIAQKIRNSEKLPDFDLSMFKAIDHLASLRNKCAHPREEPKKHEVRELIDKTKKITFMAFS